MVNTVNQLLASGASAQKQGNFIEAEKLFKAVIRLRPDHSEANYYLGVLAVDTKNIENALRYFQKALKKNNKIGKYWVSAIEVLIQLKRYAEAASLLQKGQAIGLKGKKIDRL